VRVISTLYGVAFRVANHHHLKFYAHTVADFLQFALLGVKIRLPSKCVCFPGSTGHEHHMPYLLRTGERVGVFYFVINTFLQNFKESFECCPIYIAGFLTKLTVVLHIRPSYACPALSGHVWPCRRTSRFSFVGILGDFFACLSIPVHLFPWIAVDSSTNMEGI
jgi:hypothetical protein